MAVAGGTMPANMIKLQDGVPVVKHRENRPSEVLQHDLEAAESLLRSGLTAWVPAALFLELRERMAPQGALAETPKRPYIQFDDTDQAVGLPVYTGTCAERHDAELDALKMALDLVVRRLQDVERKLAAERRWVIKLSQQVEELEKLAERWTADS